jgi:hypothetical protein
LRPAGAPNASPSIAACRALRTGERKADSLSRRAELISMETAIRLGNLNEQIGNLFGA